MDQFEDNLAPVWDKFFSHRTESLWKRFSGIYRAVVIETNDPLNMHRIRFKCPDMHDNDLKSEDCPWAMPGNHLGGPRTGEWRSACIGDHVWISFERNHPYGPVWIGFANPSRRKFYPYSSTYCISPISVNEEGDNASSPKDFSKKYLPKDSRPMSQGICDRYGTVDILSSTGFFPSTHSTPPTSIDYDPLQKAKFKTEKEPPKVNDPDLKYSARITKYGNMFIMGDQGYDWKSEFEGDPEKDEKYEIKRWKYIQKLLNEGNPATAEGKGDQRRIELKTRYGSRIEIRDTGYNKPRTSEYNKDGSKISKTQDDYRWIKMRTKSGMLFQMSDISNVPENKNGKKANVEDCGVKSEREDKYWKDIDARWIRLVTPSGFKFVIDDRGSHPLDPKGQELPRGNGFLIKGRRSPASDAKPKKNDPRGFFWQINENDKLNHMAMGSPLGQMIEINDRYEYIAMASRLGQSYSTKWQGTKDNEFLDKPAMLKNPYKNAYHLVLDLANEMLSLKSRASRGKDPDTIRNPTGLSNEHIAQGMEVHDGKNGDGPWVELVDGERRGLWLSKDNKLSIFRARKRKKLYIWMDEKKNELVIFNDCKNGKIKLYSKGDVELRSAANITVQGRNINFKASESIKFECSGNSAVLDSSAFSTARSVNARTVNGTLTGAQRGSGAGTASGRSVSVTAINKPEVPKKIEPTDRGKIYYAPEACPGDEIRHPKPV